MTMLLRLLVFAALLRARRVFDDTSRRNTQPPYSPTILISLDGFRADYIDRGLTPTLAALAQRRRARARR